MEKVLMIITCLCVLGLGIAFAAHQKAKPYLHVLNNTGDTVIYVQAGLGGACWNSGPLFIGQHKVYQPSEGCRQVDLYIFNKKNSP